MSSEIAIVDSAETPRPIYSGQQMEEAVTAYRRLQEALDRSMPDQIMRIGDKRFRKKGYWRAIAVAFKLTVEPTDERREVQGAFRDGAENFGYILTYRATAPNGRSTTGDGSCFAIEKVARFRCGHPHPTQRGKWEHFPATTCPDYTADYMWATRPLEASEHNVRSHAHTRAFNRAVSNLVGFGEVSGEEIEYWRPEEVTAPIDITKVPPYEGPTEDGEPSKNEPTISVQQAKRLWAIAKSKGWSDSGIKLLLSQRGYEHGTEVPRRLYNGLVQHVETQAPS